MTIGYFIKKSFARMVLLLMVIGFFVGLCFINLNHAQTVIPFAKTHSLGKVILGVVAWTIACLATIAAFVAAIWWAVLTAFDLEYCEKCQATRKKGHERHFYED